MGVFFNLMCPFVFGLLSSWLYGSPTTKHWHSKTEGKPMQATPEQVLFRKFEAEGAASAFANEAGQLQRVRKLPSGYSMRRRAALEVAKKPLLGLSERSLGARVSFFGY